MTFQDRDTNLVSLSRINETWKCIKLQIIKDKREEIYRYPGVINYAIILSAVEKCFVFVLH